jgi:hypothetical protein
MSGDENGCAPREITMDQVIEMNDFRPMLALEPQQPASRALEVGPRLRHPLEPEGAFLEDDAGKPCDG